MSNNLKTIRTILYILCGMTMGGLIITLLHGTGIIFGAIVGGPFGYILSLSGFSSDPEKDEEKVNKVEFAALAVTLIAAVTIIIILL